MKQPNAVLAHLVDALGIKQTDLAASVNVEPPTISQGISGSRGLSKQLLLAIWDLHRDDFVRLGYGFEDLVRGTRERETPESARVTG